MVLKFMNYASSNLRKETMMNITLYELVGGLPTLIKVHKIFYDKVYVHPWLGQFFVGHNQQVIENKQTSFIAEKMGGPAPYLGKEIKMVHEEMYITTELFDIRRELLESALNEVGIEGALKLRWLKIDSAFKHHIVKDSIESMYENDWKYKKPIIIPKPK